MDIDALMYSPGADVYYDSTVRNVFDDHMTYLRNLSGNMSVAVTPKDIERFQGDLYGLFTALGIAPQYHYVVRQVNELTSPQIVPTDLTSLLLPDFKVVDQIRLAQTTANRVG